MILMVKAAWAYRQFVVSSIKAELNGRYARSKLGIVWMVLHPLAQAAVLALVLSQILGARLSGIDSDYAYAIYLLSGLLAWNFFSETVSNSIVMFHQRANLLKKVNFPRVCIPLIVAGSAIVNHLLFLIIVIGIVWILGVEPSHYLWMLLPASILIIGMAVGLGIILGVFDVFNRDVSNFWGVVVQFWFWLTPIVYSPEILPEYVKELLVWNPVYPMILAYQQAIAYGSFVETTPLLKAAGITTLLLIFSFVLFIRSSSDVVDAL